MTGPRSVEVLSEAAHKLRHLEETALSLGHVDVARLAAAQAKKYDERARRLRTSQTSRHED